MHHQLEFCHKVGIRTKFLTRFFTLLLLIPHLIFFFFFIFNQVSLHNTMPLHYTKLTANANHPLPPQLCTFHIPIGGGFSFNVVIKKEEGGGISTNKPTHSQLSLLGVKLMCELVPSVYFFIYFMLFWTPQLSLCEIGCWHLDLQGEA